MISNLKKKISQKFGFSKASQSSALTEECFENGTSPATPSNILSKHILVSNPHNLNRLACLAFWSIMFFFSMCFVMLAAQDVTHRRVRLDLPPLPDLLHENLPLIKPHNLGDKMMFFLIVFNVVLYLYYFKRLKENHWIGVIHMYTTWGFYYLMRAPLLLFTTIPLTEHSVCRTEYKPIAHPVINAILGVVTMGNLNKHCGDLMYSGHTVSLMIWVLTYRKYLNPILHWSGMVFVYIWAGATMLVFITTQSHYTIDVIVAFYVSILMYPQVEWIIKKVLNVDTNLLLPR